MNTYNQFSTDQNLETGGIEFDLGSAGVFRLARAGGRNKRFTKRLEEVTKPYRRQIQSGTFTNEVAEGLLQQVFAETVLLGWEGVTDANGNGLPFSQQNARKLFSDLPELFRALQEAAQDVALFRAAAMESDLGNSPTDSGGS